MIPVLRRTLVLVTLSAGLVLSAGSPASASCAQPLSLTDALARADLVVVGTVTASRSANRIATVTVEDIWKGTAGPVVEVAGGPDSPNRATSVDRTYAVGTRYLFFIFEPAANIGPGTNRPRYEDNSCTNTRPFTADLETLRPGTARRIAASSPTGPAPPQQNDPSGGGNVAFAVGFGALAAIIAVAIVLLMRRGRRMRAPASG